MVQKKKKKEVLFNGNQINPLGTGHLEEDYWGPMTKKTLIAEHPSQVIARTGLGITYPT